MQNYKTISIAMATYNGEKYIQKQLESLENQKYKPIEIIICDDCSTDRTIEICDNFSKKSSFTVKIIKNDKKLGFIENFFKAASLCSGDLIAFCDQDDIWENDKLERAQKSFFDSKIAIFGHASKLITEKGNIIGHHGLSLQSGTYSIADLDPWDLVYGFSIVIKRSVWNSVDPNDRPTDPFCRTEKLSHDRWAYFLGTAAGSMAYDSQPLARYSQHGNNVFGSKKSRKNRILEKLHLISIDREEYISLLLQSCDKMSKISESFLNEGLDVNKSPSFIYYILAKKYKNRLSIFSNNKLYSVLKFLRCLLDGSYQEKNIKNKYKEILCDFIYIFIKK